MWLCVSVASPVLLHIAAFFFSSSHYSLFPSLAVAAVELQACLLNKSFIQVPVPIFLRAAGTCPERA